MDKIISDAEEWQTQTLHNISTLQQQTNTLYWMAQDNVIAFTCIRHHVALSVHVTRAWDDLRAQSWERACNRWPVKSNTGLYIVLCVIVCIYGTMCEPLTKSTGHGVLFSPSEPSCKCRIGIKKLQPFYMSRVILLLQNKLKLAFYPFKPCGALGATFKIHKHTSIACSFQIKQKHKNQTLTFSN